MTYDFDILAALAKTDPDAFDRRRLELIETTIQNSLGSKRSLRGLQFRIDLERQKAKTPLKSCLQISSMMWDSFFSMNEKLNKLALDQHGNCYALVSGSQSPAKILPFHKR